MDTPDARDPVADRAADPTYPFPTSGDGSVPQAHPSVRILDDSGGASAGGPEARAQVLRGELAQRAAGDGESADLVASETRVARARRSRHESAQRELATRAAVAGSGAVLVAALGGFVAGLWWAERRRPRLRLW